MIQNAIFRRCDQRLRAGFHVNGVGVEVGVGSPGLRSIFNGLSNFSLQWYFHKDLHLQRSNAVEKSPLIVLPPSSKRLVSEILPSLLCPSLVHAIG